MSNTNIIPERGRNFHDLPFGCLGNIIYILCNFSFVAFISWAFYLASIKPWRIATNTNEGNSDFNIFNISIGFCILIIVSFIILLFMYCIDSMCKRFNKKCWKNDENDTYENNIEII